MKIKLSKSQWEIIGKKASWMKKAELSHYDHAVKAYVEDVKSRGDTQFRGDFALGALQEATISVLSDIDNALNGIYMKNSIVDALGARGIIEKIRGLKESSGSSSSGSSTTAKEI